MIRDAQTKNKDKGSPIYQNTPEGDCDTDGESKVEVNPINDTVGGSKTEYNRQERNDYLSKSRHQ